jgi:hypothetical protein
MFLLIYQLLRLTLTDDTQYQILGRLFPADKPIEPPHQLFRQCCTLCLRLWLDLVGCVERKIGKQFTE